VTGATSLTGGSHRVVIDGVVLHHVNISQTKLFLGARVRVTGLVSTVNKGSKDNTGSIKRHEGRK
jgi:hypothetical protein